LPWQPNNYAVMKANFSEMAEARAVKFCTKGD